MRSNSFTCPRHLVTLSDRAESLRRKYNREQGDCVVFGMGDAGELGLGQAQNDIGFNRLIVPNLRGKNIVAISCGAQHTLAIDSVGKGEYPMKYTLLL